MIIVNQTSVASPNNLKSVEYLTEEYKKLDLKYPKFHKMDVLSKLGIIAIEYLLQNQDINKKNTGLILSSHKGCFQTDIDFNSTIQHDHFFPSPTLFVYTLPNIVLGEICIKHGFTGENIFLMKIGWTTIEMEFLVEEFSKDTGMSYVILGHLDGDEQSCEANVFLFKTP